MNWARLKKAFAPQRGRATSHHRSDSSPLVTRSTTNSRPVRMMAMTSLVSLFLLVPLILTQSIIFLQPELGAGVLALLAAVIMTALPFHGRETNTRFFFGLLVAYIIANVLWPEYIAIDLPGLPFITPSRVLLTVLIFCWVFITATSRPIYERLLGRLGALKLITVPIGLIIVLKLISMLLTPYPFLANIGFFDQFITWYLPFLIALTFFNSRESIAYGMKAFVIAASIVAVAVVWESFSHINPYSHYLGQFIKVDQRWLEEVFTPQYRDQLKYRAMGPFVIHLSMAEFMTLSMPFALYWIETSKSFWRRAFAFVSLLLYGYCVYSADSRTSMVTAAFIVGLYLLVKALIHIWRRPDSRARPFVLLVIMAGMLATPVALISALNAMNWENAFGSTGTRFVQLQLAGPKIAHSPLIGYGPGNGTAAYVLDYKSNGRDLTIDNYYLTAILETGVPGLILFLFIPATFVLLSFARAFQRRSDAGLYLAFALFGTTFALIRTTLSQNENMNLFYIFLGAFVVLTSLPAPEAVPEVVPTRNMRKRRRTGSGQLMGHGRVGRLAGRMAAR